MQSSMLLNLALTFPTALFLAGCGDKDDEDISTSSDPTDERTGTDDGASTDVGTGTDVGTNTDDEFSYFNQIEIAEMVCKHRFEVVLGVSAAVSKPRGEGGVVGDC